MKTNTIRFKISVIYTAILCAILCVYAAVLYGAVGFTLLAQTDELLTKKSEKIISTVSSYCKYLGKSESSYKYAFERISGLPTEHSNHTAIETYENQWFHEHDLLGISDDLLVFLNKDGSLVAHSEKMTDDLYGEFIKGLDVLISEDHYAKTVKFKGGRLRVFSRRFKCPENNEYIIQVGTSLNELFSVMRKSLFLLLIPIPFILVASFFLGRFLASSILKPVKRITEAAKNITHEDLTSRVEAVDADEEMRYLVDAFNDMIERLKEAFDHANQLSSQVAHELKTPLAIIKGEAEIALRKDRSLEEYKRIITLCDEESARMRKITEDLLLLSRIDFKPEIFKFVKLGLPFFSDLIEAGKIMASQKNIGLKSVLPDKDFVLNADETHLRRLFLNLIDNAIKYSRPESDIYFNVELEDNNVSVSVCDNGIGIAEENQTKIFDRFYRVDKYAQEIIGTGLGLSMVKSIADLHNGSISVESQLGQGSTFKVLLPISNL